MGAEPTLVDSSAWVEFFRATGSSAHRALKDRLGGGGELATIQPVAMELLAGIGKPAEELEVRGALAACRTVPVDNGTDWEQASEIFRACRRAGVTPRRMIDCLIAAVAIRVGAPVLAQDRDYELIAEHTALELVVQDG